MAKSPVPPRTTSPVSVTTPDNTLTLTVIKNEPRIDSRLLALNMDTAHQNCFELIKDHKADFEELGIVRFETGEIKGRGRPERFALLNEDQSYLLLTYSRNNATTRRLKINLVKSFGEARRAAGQHGAEYLPTYHALHDELHALAAGSDNEKFVHMNVNKLINKAVGIVAGQRPAASLPTQALLTVAQAVATSAAKGAPDHHAGYQSIKAAMSTLSAAIGIAAAPKKLT